MRVLVVSDGTVTVHSDTMSTLRMLELQRAMARVEAQRRAAQLEELVLRVADPDTTPSALDLLEVPVLVERPEPPRRPFDRAQLRARAPVQSRTAYHPAPRRPGYRTPRSR